MVQQLTPQQRQALLMEGKFPITKWYNPLPTRQRFSIMEGQDPRPFPIGTGRVYLVEPGGTVEVPSYYDDAVQKVNKSVDPLDPLAETPGVIVGGLAPQLINTNLPEDKRPRLHEALDTRLAQKLEEEAQVAAASRLLSTAVHVQQMAARVVVDANQQASPQPSPEPRAPQPAPKVEPGLPEELAAQTTQPRHPKVK